MITLDDRLDDLRREKGEPDEPAHIVFRETLAFSDLDHGGYSASDQFVEPAMRPSDGFQKGRICILSLTLIAIHYQSQFDAAAFYLHRDEARHRNAGMHLRLCGLG